MNAQTGRCPAVLVWIGHGLIALGAWCALQVTTASDVLAQEVAAVQEAREGQAAAPPAASAQTAPPGPLDGFVEFESGKKRIRRDQRPAMKALARYLRDHPGLRQLQIVGHADRRGMRLSNLRLSYERAEQVRNYLVKLGIGKERMKVVAVGAQDAPPGQRGRARAQSRRVTFKVETP